MGIRWNLKKWLATERDIYRPSELRTLLAERVGLELSLQAVSTLINRKPAALRLRTIQALCQALHCRLSDFCEVDSDVDRAVAAPPRVATTRVAGRRQRDQHVAKPTDGITFPDPRDFPIDRDHGNRR